MLSLRVNLDMGKIVYANLIVSTSKYLTNKSHRKVRALNCTENKPYLERSPFPLSRKGKRFCYRRSLKLQISIVSSYM